MHIAQLISHYVPAVRYGGPQQVAHGLGRALVKSGHRVSVCATNLKNETEDLDVPVNQPVDVDGVCVRYMATRWSRYWGYAPHLYREADHVIAGADAVVVHFHYQYANYVGARLARKHKKPYVLFAHGSFKQDAMRRRGRLLKSMYLRLLERNNLAAAEKIIFNAEEERRLSRFAESGIVLPNAIEPSDFDNDQVKGAFREKLGISANDPLFLFLGRIDFHGKGLDLLLAAMSQLNGDLPKPHVVFAGPDERNGVQQLTARAHELGLNDNLSIVGMITGKDKQSALIDADAFLLPSRSEGLSIALLEALYQGTPVLTTDQVGLHEKVEELGAGKVVPATIDGIRTGLRLLLEDSTRESMRGRATAFINTHHTWSAIAEQILPLLKPN